MEQEKRIKLLSEDEWERLDTAFMNGLTLSAIFEKLQLDEEAIGELSAYGDMTEFGESIVDAGIGGYMKDECGTILYTPCEMTIGEALEEAKNLKNGKLGYGDLEYEVAELIMGLSTRETSNVVENLKRQYGLRTLVEELKLAGIIDSFNEDKI
jgi:hypothetical protein